MKGLNASSQYSLSYFSTYLNCVVSVSEDLRLNNGGKSVLLADSGISSESVSSFSNGELRWAAISNLEDGSPLGESRTSLIVLLASLSETVETSGGLFLVSAWQEDETLVDLDAWDDVLCLEEVNEGSAVSRVLEQSLLEEDNSTDSVL